jgi:excisionase family DNA binding protein
MMNTNLPPMAVTVSEAARLLGVGKSFLYRELHAGRITLPLLHMGKKTLIRVADLERFLAEQAAQTS